MSSIINTNSLSLLTQNNLLKSQSSLTTAIQRLSSGLRINSAKDDAAGQAIANRFSSNIKGLSQAQRNANDGISLAQTTEGALNEINNNLQRVRELTVQAANGSNSKTDLDSIQSEITQRMAEIDRTSAQTDFNGTKVLGVTAATLKIQVGANDGETIDIGLQTINTSTLGVASFNINGTGTVNTASTLNDLTLAGGFSTVGGPVSGTQQYEKTTLGATTNNTAATATNVFSKAVAGTTVTLNGSATPADNYTVTGSGATAIFSTGTTNAAANATVKGQLIPIAGSQTSAVVTIGGTTQNIKIDSTGNIRDSSDNQMYLDLSGNLTLTSAGAVAANIGAGDAGDVLKSMSNGVNDGAGTSTGGTIVAGTASGTTSTYTVASAATNSLANFTISTALTQAAMIAKAAPGSALVDINGTAGGGDDYTISAAGAVTENGAAVFVAAGALTLDPTTTAASTVENYYVHSNGAVTDGSSNTVYNDSANAGKFALTARSGSTSTVDAMKVIDAALAKVDGLRGSLGAVQNRFDSVISNLGSTITNLSASRSRIEDADYATEVSNMTRAQILQQAGTSVLAKANQSTQGVMSLLQ